jgi:hypothetical protein
LISAIDGGKWSASLPGRFTPGERTPGTLWIGGWVGPRSILVAVVKIKIPNPRRESSPRSPSHMVKVKVKVNVMLSLFLTKQHKMKGYWGMEV